MIKKLYLNILAAAFVLAFCSPVHATTPAPVSGQVADSGSNCSSGLWNTTCDSSNMPSNTTAGQYVIAHAFFGCSDVVCSGSGTAVVSIATSGGDNFTECLNSNSGGSGTSGISHEGIWYVKVVTPGNHFIANANGYTLYYGSFTYREVTGIASSSPCDSATGHVATGSGTSLSVTMAAATSECNEFATAWFNSGHTLTNTGTFTAFATQPFTTQLQSYTATSPSSTTTETATATNGTSEVWTARMVAFKSDAGSCAVAVVERRTPKNPRSGSRQVR